jgi:hypothetical protein
MFWPTEAIIREITDKVGYIFIKNVIVDVQKQNRITVPSG